MLETTKTFRRLITGNECNKVIHVV